ncbi:MAG: Ig-like domain-containing protein [Patescibacteria group bacterium]
MFFKNKNNKNIPTSHRVAWIICAGVFLALAVGTVLWSYVPQPTLNVQLRDNRVPLDAAIQIDFSVPISREISVTMAPETFGEVAYSRFVTQNHLARTITFQPEVTWLPDTTYQIKISGIRSAWPTYRQPRAAMFSFTTAAIPSLVSVSPKASDELSPDSSWVFAYDAPRQPGVEFSYEFSPAIKFVIQTGADGKTTALKPTEQLAQGTSYALSVYQKTIRYNFNTQDIAYQSEPQLVKKETWTVKEAPGVEKVAPAGTAVGLQEPIDIAFTQPMDFVSFKENISISPSASGTWTAISAANFVFKPSQYALDTNYHLTVAKGTKNTSGGFLTEDATYEFTTLGPVDVSQTIPVDKSAGIGVDSTVRIAFDQPVDRNSAQAHFSISPAVAGDFSWDGNTMLFKPTSPLAFNFSYSVLISKDVSGTSAGFEMEKDYSFSFSTEQSITKLTVAFDRQDHKLSCEFASLSMALKYKGANIGEAPLINIVGFDPTLKSNGVWGNPNVAFVGDIDGHQPSTGYGVYWDPIAIAAKAYRMARAFSGWKVADLTAEIKKGNPVVVWGTAGSGKRIDWKTPQGGNVVAVSGEHARVAIGFIGPAENPTKIITMDPLYGEKYFTRSSFEWNWGLLGNSGVVVE